MKRFFSPILKSSTGPPESNAANVISGDVDNDNNKKRTCIEIELSDNDIVSDPGLRKPIDSYPIGVRDDLRRRYVDKGPCRTYEHKFKQTNHSGKMRSFQSQWFDEFQWLEYSVSKDAAFCLLCYLFPRGHKHGDDIFTEVGFRNWKKALEKFREHEGGQKTVLDVVRLLLEQGLAFRGNDESENSKRRGNFLAIIKWYCDRSEKVAEVMNSKAPGNNQLTSPKIQKEIINACACEVRKVIFAEIGNKYFSLLIDESRDSSVKEQMAIVLRFVNGHGEVVERFVGVVHVTDTSAESLKNGVDNFLANNGLSLSKVRGQGYDGASNMRGEINGLKRRILDENKQAHYIHCFAHQLQLVVVTTSKVHGLVSGFFDYLLMIVNVVGASCKRKDTLLQKHHENLVRMVDSGEISTGKGKNQATSLARPGDTRWGSHFKTIVRLLDMWDAIKEVLEIIFEDAIDSKNKGVAASLVDKMESFEFVFIAHLLKKLLAKTNTLSIALQQKNQNIGNAVVYIRMVKEDLQKYREDCGWDELLENVNNFCIKHDIVVPDMKDVMPGRVKRKMTVDGNSKTYYHYFRRDIFFQVLDLIIEEMNNRFSETSSELLMCMSCLDPTDSFVNFDQKRLIRLAELYPDDFSAEEMVELVEQLIHYISFIKSSPDFQGLDDIGALAKKLVATGWHNYFKLVYRLIELVLVLPVGTASVERSFSAMKIIKNDLRNKMGDEFLMDCMLCYVENEIFLDIDNEVILQRFQNMATRRIQLPSIGHSGQE